MSASTVIFVTKDLFFIPMLKQATERAGHVFVVVPSVSNSRLTDISSADVVACIVDLTAISVDEIANVLLQLKDRFTNATQAAFGPHVHERHLQTATQVGFDSVLTRGQLNKNPDHWLAAWTSKSEEEH